MEFDWAGLLPDLLPGGMSPLVAILLLGISAFTSLISAAFGLGGGLVLLAVMATVMPAAALVPVHGVVQIGSNFGRATVMVRHIY
ncbi:MAG: sulfite exporter TauE/SafE family protein, partial [Rhodospirillaceae bacterium]|nr:sulfite exporter TauE/SafE family protein [Rhodospirillaceae bacterium]